MADDHDCFVGHELSMVLPTVHSLVGVVGAGRHVPDLLAETKLDASHPIRVGKRGVSCKPGCPPSLFHKRAACPDSLDEHM